MEARLDVFLVSNGYYESRNRAQDAIKEGHIKINGKVTNKASFKVLNTDKIEVSDAKDEYASRGAYKLIDALDSFNIDLYDKVVLDIGASTGGFSDVCLKRNAAFVFAVDVGHNQLVERLANDIRLKNMEGINCRYLNSEMFNKHLDFICMDVSFISLNKIFDNLITFVKPPYEMVFLIKPQFEAGKAFIGKNGIVKDERVHLKILENYLEYFEKLNVSVCGLKKCKICGRDGNQEYLIYLNSEKVSKSFNLKEIVKVKG